ncbi:hypothetical protein BH791_gp24 [Bacillus phage BalMu-1]|nr:hypothetical protein BH791_gp24 [Bacillus phage BalMu-1]AJA42402.1 hypothetical protein BalMu1_B24 [Bacillus phage BalMu-1]AJA42458.1 hypothetical protein BalMu1_A24 [Bacillus phage BalMu-1]
MMQQKLALPLNMRHLESDSSEVCWSHMNVVKEQSYFWADSRN